MMDTLAKKDKVSVQNVYIQLKKMLNKYVAKVSILLDVPISANTPVSSITQLRKTDVRRIS